MADWRILPGSRVGHLWPDPDDDPIQVSLCERVRYCISENTTVRLAAMPEAKRCRICERRKARAA